MAEAVINRIRRLTEPVYYKFILIPRAKIRQYWRVRQIQKAGKARVVFLVCSLPMWRAQQVYRCLQEDSRFEVFVAIYPPCVWTDGQRSRAVSVLRAFFKKEQIQILDLSKEILPGKALRTALNPDLIFYPLPYNHLFWNDLDNQYFGDKLICHIPYGMPVVRTTWIDKSLLNNTAWRLFYHSEARKQQAQELLYNHGQNIRITGDPIFDLYKGSNYTTVWKKQTRLKKRVIWAPHYSIQDTDWLHHNSFSWLYDTMLMLSEKYKDKIQFSFKPHPRLFSSLCELPEWGEERTEAYYQAWAKGENTQLDTGAYVDLFKESDAMIHDSSSFTAEYHFTGNPVLFTSKDINTLLDELNEFGRNALSAHYLCNSISGIIDFMENVVLGESDPKKIDRETFSKKFLCLPKGFSASENIYQEILIGLGFKS